MAKLQHTKTELKRQRDSLRRFERYLPTLQLKKQQLQLEARRLEVLIQEKEAERQRVRRELEVWIKLFSEAPAAPWWREEPPFDFAAHLRIEAVRISEGNVAGVLVPVLDEVVFQKKLPDLWATPPWVDDGLRTLEQLIRLRAEETILAEQHRRIREELRVTTQRVNLFEKVMIPQCHENIRVIRIFLGDQQTAEVARAKLAKGRSIEKVRAA